MQLLPLRPAGETGLGSWWKGMQGGCIFQEGERIEEISNYKDNGIEWLVLSVIVGSEKTDKRP